MRTAFVFLSVVTMSVLVASGCSLEPLGKSGVDASKTSDAGALDSGADAGLLGAGCGTETGSGAQLCRATSACPSVVIDSDAFPHCGFLLKGGSTELVCACGSSLCSMGPYVTCAQAASLLRGQTESQVCTQILEGRCTEGKSTPGTSSGASAGTKPGCDRTCLQECGGAAGCASICGC